MNTLTLDFEYGESSTHFSSSNGHNCQIIWFEKFETVCRASPLIVKYIFTIVVLPWPWPLDPKILPVQMHTTTYPWKFKKNVIKVCGDKTILSYILTDIRYIDGQAIMILGHYIWGRNNFTIIALRCSSLNFLPRCHLICRIARKHDNVILIDIHDITCQFNGPGVYIQCTQTGKRGIE